MRDLSPRLKEESHGPAHRISLRPGMLCRLLFYHALRCRLRVGRCGAENHRHWSERSDGGSIRRRSTPDLCLRDPAQRDGSQAFQAMVDEVRPGRGRAKHVCTVLEPDTCPAVLAMATDAG